MSEDGGKSWRGAEEYSGSAVLSTGAQVEGLEWNRTYLFQLAVEGGPMAGRSNVLEFPLYDDYHVNGGGSRDDDDRGDLGELPPGTSWCRPRKAPQGKSVFSPGPETWENLPPPSAGAPEGGAARHGNWGKRGGAQRRFRPGRAGVARPRAGEEKLRPRFGRSCWAERWLWRRERRCWACVHTAPAGMGSGERGRTAMREKQRFSPAFALALGAVVLASCALFLFCYRADNKYTAPRPVSGPA